MMRLFRHKPRVLLLDDDLSMQKLMRVLLQRAGYRVDVVNKGREAIEAMEKKDYSVVLLDLMMPTEGGMTVIRHFRERDPEKLKRVIVVTASSDSIVKSVAADVADVVRKPFEADEL